MGELKKTFRPEFLNRVDDIIVFRQLTKEDIHEIARRMLTSLDKRLKDMDITVQVTDAAVEAIAAEGFDPVYGARSPAPRHPVPHRGSAGGKAAGGRLPGRGFRDSGLCRRGFPVR